MKREIKFRAWDSGANIMIYSDNRTRKLYDVYYGFEMNEKGELECRWEGDFTESQVADGGILDNIMQFTGLHDKNGREIYDSDILKVTGEDGESYVATVKWFGDEGYPAFDLEGIPAAWNYDANALATIFNSGAEACEVIGNIYEKNDCEGKQL